MEGQALTTVRRFLGRVVLAIFFALCAAITANTLSLESTQLQVQPVTTLTLDENAAAERLAGGIRFRTVSWDEQPAVSLDAFHRLHAYLRQQFPNVHRELRLDLVADASLLYTWPGHDVTVKPIALLAHQDVVPVEPGTERDWKVDPFAGIVQEGFVWGRGAWDDKGSLFAILEAVELLVRDGFRPRQTVFLIFGHDEEVVGGKGAQSVAALLQSRGVKLDFVLDEGLIITEGVLERLEQPLALIGVGEKGYVNVSFRANFEGGHSSMPPPVTAIGAMSRALSELEAHPMPSAIGGSAAQLFETIAPEMGILDRVLLSNLWLFGPLVKARLEAVPSNNAMLRTTMALTVVQGGNKDNVLPSRIDANANFRILPGDSSDDVLRHVKSVVKDAAIQIAKVEPATEPSGLSSTTSASFMHIHRTIREVFPETLVAPGLMIGATDARYFAAIADNIYRFAPVRAQPEDLSRFHGVNERISIANFADMIRFYRRLLINVAGELGKRGQD